MLGATRKACLTLILLFLLTSCGYRWGRGELIEHYSSVCIPYVDGDEEGVMTAALIRAMTTSGALAYRSRGADLQLLVCLLPPEDENIGFVYAPDDQDIVVSNEARLTLSSSVRLVDRRTGCLILGPLEITSSLTYDFEPDLTNVNENAFSLGQLEMNNPAQRAAFPSLYTLLSEKIVDYVNHCW